MKLQTLLLSFVLFFLTIQVTSAQTVEPAIIDDKPAINTQATTIPLPDFDCYTDNTADFLYIEWKETAAYSSARFEILDANGKQKQKGHLRSTFTSKVPIGELDKGIYEVVFYDEKGKLFEREKVQIL